MKYRHGELASAVVLRLHEHDHFTRPHRVARVEAAAVAELTHSTKGRAVSDGAPRRRGGSTRQAHLGASHPSQVQRGLGVEASSVQDHGREGAIATPRLELVRRVHARHNGADAGVLTVLEQ